MAPSSVKRKSSWLEPRGDSQLDGQYELAQHDLVRPTDVVAFSRVARTGESLTFRLGHDWIARVGCIVFGLCRERFREVLILDWWIYCKHPMHIFLRIQLTPMLIVLTLRSIRGVNRVEVSIAVPRISKKLKRFKKWEVRIELQEKHSIDACMHVLVKTIEKQESSFHVKLRRLMRQPCVHPSSVTKRIIGCIPNTSNKGRILHVHVARKYRILLIYNCLHLLWTDAQ